MVLVHSIHAAAWNMEWRNVFAEFAREHTVYAIDLLGFGASERPAVHYSAALYVELLEAFVRDVVADATIVIGSSLGATYALRAASRDAATPTPRIRALVLVGPAGVSRLRNPSTALTRLTESLFRSSWPGASLFGALTSRISIRFFLRSIYHDRRVMTSAVVDLYWRGAQQPGARFAPAAFVGMQLNCDVTHDLETVAVPTLLLWGRYAAQTPAREAAAVHARRPELPLAMLDAGDLPHDERPVEFLDAVRGFLRSHVHHGTTETPGVKAEHAATRA